MKPAFLVSLLAALVLGAALLTLNIIRPGPDNGRIEERCRAGVTGPLAWEPSRLPVHVVVDPSAGSWMATLIEAAKAWNAAAGREVLTVEPAAETSWVEYADALAGAGREPAGTAFVYSSIEPMLSAPRMAGIEDPWGLTRLRWRPDTCALGYAVVWLRDSPDSLGASFASEVATHELGHVLGLAHDGRTTSIMVRDLARPGPDHPTFPHEITAHDAAIVAQ